ncbi:MAG: hypothetical protein ACOWWO_16260 [Peptococcaceae bacterium]
MISILVVVPVLVVILIIFFAAGSKAGVSGGEDLIKNVYVYLVLFATLMMTIGGSVGVFMAAADIIAPVPYQQTFEEFKRWGGVGKPLAENNGLTAAILSEDELRKNYQEMIQAEQERQLSRAKNSLVKSLGWIVIPLPVFIYFQRYLGKKQTEDDKG